MGEIGSAKATLRRRMLAARRAVPDPLDRSAAIWERVESLGAVRPSAVVMAFSSVHGEPVTTSFIAGCRAAGCAVVLPEDVPPPDARLIDVIVVPGLAFTVDGRRLGQGGGWYDRFLPGLRDHCPMIGVAFEVQIVDELPTEPHDVTLDVVVTEHRVCRADGRGGL